MIIPQSAPFLRAQGGQYLPQYSPQFPCPRKTLAEAKVFGFMKGAYTGATDSKPGLVEAAAGGTLFLDEFGALPDAIQPMFLTFLETGEFSRVGSTTVRKANVRVIAATNGDLGAAIAEGQFREDLVARMSLYYEVPPLRERRREIAGIVDRYCTLFTKDGLIGLDLVEDGIRNQQIVTSRSSEEVTKPPNPRVTRT